MLDSFYDEVRRKRNSYMIFWVIVLGFAVLLYMFFQGYYFNVSLGFERLIHGGSPTEVTQSGAIIPPESILKSFGIINLRVTPAPSAMTINGLPYQNGDKQIFDYGTYSLDVQNPGYLPIKIRIELSKTKSFYLNTIRMLRLTQEMKTPEPLTSIVKNGPAYIATTESGEYKILISPYGSGSAITISNSSTGSLRHIGEGYFSGEGKLYTTDAKGLLSITEIQKGITICVDARMIRGDIFCPKLGVFLTGKYRDLREKIVEANTDFIRTSNSIIRLGGTFFNSSTPLTSTISFSGASHLLSYHDRLMIHNNGRLYDLEKSLSETVIPGIEYIETTKKFGDETLTLGKSKGLNTLVLEDGKSDPIQVTLPGESLAGADIIEHAGAYFISTPRQVLVYYKGALEPIVIASGEILALVDTTVFYKKNGTTYTVTAQGAE